MALANIRPNNLPTYTKRTVAIALAFLGIATLNPGTPDTPVTPDTPISESTSTDGATSTVVERAAAAATSDTDEFATDTSPDVGTAAEVAEAAPVEVAEVAEVAEEIVQADVDAETTAIDSSPLVEVVQEEQQPDSAETALTLTQPSVEIPSPTSAATESPAVIEPTEAVEKASHGVAQTAETDMAVVGTTPGKDLESGKNSAQTAVVGAVTAAAALTTKAVEKPTQETGAELVETTPSEAVQATDNAAENTVVEVAKPAANDSSNSAGQVQVAKVTDSAKATDDANRATAADTSLLLQKEPATVPASTEPQDSKEVMVPESTPEVGVTAPGKITEASIPPPKAISDLVNNYSDKLLMVVFWSVETESGSPSFDWLNEMHRRYANRGLQIMAVNQDEAARQGEAFAVKQGAQFEVTHDRSGDLRRALWVGKLPATYLLNDAGELLGSHTGFNDDIRGSYEDEIRRLLRQLR